MEAKALPQPQTLDTPTHRHLDRGELMHARGAVRQQLCEDGG
jgi:hypothetical protein